MSYQRLATTSDNRIRLETLRETNDRISNHTAKLPVFRYYHLDEQVHSSSDGQKFETQIDTVNARHSPKYFGLNKPARKVKSELILSEEDNIQLILVPLARKTTTQSILASKLSSYARKNRTKKALL